MIQRGWKTLWSWKVKGSYAVEGSLVFSIICIVIGSLLLLGFEIYQEVLTDVSAPAKDLDVLSIFRMLGR